MKSALFATEYSSAELQRPWVSAFFLGLTAPVVYLYPRLRAAPPEGLLALQPLAFPAATSNAVRTAATGLAGDPAPDAAGRPGPTRRRRGGGAGRAAASRLGRAPRWRRGPPPCSGGSAVSVSGVTATPWVGGVGVAHAQGGAAQRVVGAMKVSLFGRRTRGWGGGWARRGCSGLGRPRRRRRAVRVMLPALRCVIRVGVVERGPPWAGGDCGLGRGGEGDAAGTARSCRPPALLQGCQGRPRCGGAAGSRERAAGG